MAASTMRQITILQFGPAEVENLREGSAIPLPISPEMGVLFQQGRVELYVTLASGRRLPKMHGQGAIAAPEQMKQLSPTQEMHKGQINWSAEETEKVLQVFDKLMTQTPGQGIGKCLQIAQREVLPPDRYRTLHSFGNAGLRSLRKKITKHRKQKPELKIKTPLPLKTYQCLVKNCTGISTSAGGLAGHIVNKHCKRSKINDKLQFTCRMCTFAAGTWQEFLTHLKADHRK